LGTVQVSDFEATSELLGVISGSYAGLTDNPLIATWSSLQTTKAFIMSIYQFSEHQIGETDATGNSYSVSQNFVAKSKDISSFEIQKGDDVGSPTSDVTLSIYNTDESGNKTGSV